MKGLTCFRPWADGCQVKLYKKAKGANYRKMGSIPGAKEGQGPQSAIDGHSRCQPYSIQPGGQNSCAFDPLRACANEDWLDSSHATEPWRPGTLGRNTQMLEALIGTTVAAIIATGAFWLLVRYGRKRKKATKHNWKKASKYYFLPWLLSVAGLSLVVFQILNDAIDADDAVYAVMLFGGFVWGLVYAKSQQGCVFRPNVNTISADREQGFG